MPPPEASAIQLAWANGSTNLDFTAAAHCTLTVQASDLEGRLPRDWRLLCLADTTGIEPSAIVGTDSCGLGFAQLATLTPPSTDLEIATNQFVGNFCSLGSGHVYVARYIMDLPAGSHGTFKVVALDPSDPNAEHVIQSPEATFNGGLSGSLPPTILRTETVHQSTEYRIRILGAELQGVQTATLSAPDDSWEVPLTLTSVSATELHATAALAAWVPDCRVVVRNAGAQLASDLITADPPPPPLNPQAACQARFIEDIDPAGVIQPKDFAFVPGGWSATGSWTFHLFYIRQNQIARSACGANCIEKTLGHAVSNDLGEWTVLDTAAVSVRPGRWDDLHVWAPSIVRNGVTYYMYYTGVDVSGNQRIGVATSTDLMHWSQGDSVLTTTTAGLWVDQTKQDLRDPFVMENPSTPGEWLMYFTASGRDTPGMAAGFVRSSDIGFAPATIRAGGPLWRTQITQANRAAGVESPHVFQFGGKWWLFFTKPKGSVQDTIYALSNATSPTDTVTADWTPPQQISQIVPAGEATAYTFWHGTEYLKIAGASGGKQYLAGYNDSDQSITYTEMRAVPSPAVFAGDCPSALDAGGELRLPRQPTLRLTTANPGRGPVELELALTSRQLGEVAIHDVLGRQVRVLVEGVLEAGQTRVHWDGTDLHHTLVPSGVYFATVRFAELRRTVRLAFLR